MVCIKCGNNLEDGNHFCKNCGEPVPQSDSITDESTTEVDSVVEAHTVKKELDSFTEESSDVEVLSLDEPTSLDSSSVVSKEPEESVNEFSSNNDTLIINEPINDSSNSSSGEKESSIKPIVGEHEKQNEPMPSPKLEEGKKKSNAWIGIVVALLLLLVVCAVVLLPKLFLSKKAIVEKEVSMVFSSMRKVLKESEKNVFDFDLEKDSLGLSGNVVFNSNYKDNNIDLTKLGNYTMSFESVIDKKSNSASTQLNFLNNKSSFLLIKGLIKNKEAIISLGDLYNKGIITELDWEIKDFDFSSNQSIGNIEKLLVKTEKIVKSSIDDKDITKTNVTKEINGKKEKLTKIEHKIDLVNIVKKVLTDYSKDPEIVSLLAEMMNREEKSVKDFLEEAVKNVQNNDETMLTVNYYLKGFGEIREVEIMTSGLTILIDVEGNVYKYSVNVNSEEIFNGEYDARKKVFIFNYEGTTVTITKKNDNHAVLDVVSKIENETIKVNMDFKTKTNSKIQENDLFIKVLYNEKEVSVTSNIKLEKNKKVEDLQLNNKINLDNITLEDEEQIYSKLEEKLSPIINDIMPGLLLEDIMM